MLVPAPLRSLALVLLATAVACERVADPSSIVFPDPHLSLSAAAASGVTIGAVLPSQSTRGTTLDVQINGSGFDKTSQATLPLHGVVDPRVHVNSTRYVKPTQVVANVTISGDAALDSYDVAVALSSGKKGIGTEAFVVVLQPEALDGGYHVKAIGVSGDAAGDATNPVFCNYGPLPTVWRPDGTRITLPMGAYCGGSPQAINASGVVEGSLSGGAANASGLWFPSGNGYTLQEVPPTSSGYRPIVPGGLNDNNELFGWGQGGAKLFWYSVATGWLPVQVPANATACQSFQGINNRGELTAKCTVGGVGNAYYWSSHDAAPVLLPRPAASGDVVPHDMNDDGVIVGYGGGTGLRWRPSPAGYVLDIFPPSSTLYSIASDGTIAGSITLKSGGSGPSPAIFYSPTSYQILGVTSGGKWGEAIAIALTPTGIVPGGTEANSKALRWKAAAPAM
jgi:hypothetical protein